MNYLPKITKESLAAAQELVVRDVNKGNEAEKMIHGFEMIERLTAGNPLLQYLITTMAAMTKDTAGAMTTCYAVLNVIDHQLGAERMNHNDFWKRKGNKDA